jgi:hypothetical protein
LEALVALVVRLVGLVVDRVDLEAVDYREVGAEEVTVVDQSLPKYQDLLYAIDVCVVQCVIVRHLLILDQF